MGIFISFMVLVSVLILFIVFLPSLRKYVESDTDLTIKRNETDFDKEMSEDNTDVEK